MKVAQDQLREHLKRTLAPVYVIAGDEPLLVQESAAAVREQARVAGYTERTVFHADARFQWGELYHAACSVSMFADKRILEVRMNEPKPGTEGAKLLASYAAKLPQDVLLLVVTGKMDGTTQNSAWVSALEKVGVLVQIWPVDVARLPQWLQQRAQILGLRLSREAAHLIAERVEGNLLAGVQELEKLVLLCGAGEVDEQAVTQAVVSSARYDVFGLVDAALVGDAARTLRTLKGLRAEGEEPPLIVWAIARELRALASVRVACDGGMPIAKALQQARVWQKRQALVTQAVKRCSVAQLRSMIARCADIDRMVKGVLVGDAWQGLTDVVMALAGKRVIRKAPKLFHS
jgi:DNA polymerase III subunit delta